MSLVSVLFPLSSLHPCSQGPTLVLDGWCNRLIILLVLALPTLPFIPHIMTMVIFLTQMWALHSSPYRSPCLPVALNLNSTLLRMPFKSPQLHSPLISAAASFSVYSLRLRCRIFELFIVSRFCPIYVLFLRVLPLPDALFPSNLVSYLHWHGWLLFSFQKGLITLSSEW